MSRKKIILNTNPSWILTGLAENGGLLARYLQKTGKYDIVYYASQSNISDPNHTRQPWKSRGCLPNDAIIAQRAQQDPTYARWLAYGNLLIGDVIKEEKPDIFWGSDDIWTWGQSEYWKSSWWNRINSILHITVDSVPVAEAAYEQAKVTQNYFTWTKFAANEMKKRGPEYAHIKHIYGMTDISSYAPISPLEKKGLRKRFGLDENTTIIGAVFRNQLRKELAQAVIALSEIKRDNPSTDVKLFLHTSWSETGAGWDFPRLIKYFNLSPNDVLCTYVCKNCGNWYIAPYNGENVNCPYCGGQKCVITTNITCGVPRDEMKYVYGICDAIINPHTSGGFELSHINTLLCGLPLACTNYSAGEDFCEQSFVYPIKWFPRAEAGSSFIKASNDVGSIKQFMLRIYKMSSTEKQRIGEESRAWAAKTFSIETIGAQWEALFDSLPPKDWSSISLDYQPKNPDLPMPQIENDEEWVRTLYNKILMCEPDPQGFQHWLTSLQNKVPRDAIYRFFCDRAREDNAKNGKPVDFWTFIDRTTNRKRALMVCPQSIGDLIVTSSLLDSFHEQYKDHDLYIATQPQYAEIFAGNDKVFKVIPFQPFMENEIAMTGSGSNAEPYFHVFFHPYIGTQKILNYLSANNPKLPS